MEQQTLEAWWNLHQALIWVATRDHSRAAALRTKFDARGREVIPDSFDYDFADTYASRDVLMNFRADGPQVGREEVKRQLVAAISSGSIIAICAGTRMSPSKFDGAVVHDGDLHAESPSPPRGTHIRKVDVTNIGQYSRGDATVYQPRFLAEQVRLVFPPVAGGAADTLSEQASRLLEALSQPEPDSARPPDGIVATKPVVGDETCLQTEIVVPLSEAVFNLYNAVVGEYGESGGFGRTSDVRAGPAGVWSRREQPKKKLPKDISREIRRLDGDIFAGRKSGSKILVQLKKIRQKSR